jgi:hypothetical protein
MRIALLLVIAYLLNKESEGEVFLLILAFMLAFAGGCV